MKNVRLLYITVLFGAISASYGQDVPVNTSVEKDTVIAFEMSSRSSNVEDENGSVSQEIQYSMSEANYLQPAMEVDKPPKDSVLVENRISLKVIDSSTIQIAPFRKEN
jgi:hypothetical protein